MAIKNRKASRKREIDLSGPMGNAYCLMGEASRYAEQLGLDKKKIIEEMKSGDYENLLEVFDSYFGEYIDLIR